MLQGIAALLAVFIHLIDTKGFIIHLYPKDWALEKAAVRLSFGPYYATSCIILLGLLGMVSLPFFAPSQSSTDGTRCAFSCPQLSPNPAHSRAHSRTTHA